MSNAEFYKYIPRSYFLKFIYSFHFFKRYLKRAFLPKYIIFLHRNDCWCISFPYCRILRRPQNFAKSPPQICPMQSYVLCTPVKSSVEISQNFMAFLEYMNFIKSYVVKDSLMEFKLLHRISNAVVWLRSYLF